MQRTVLPPSATMQQAWALTLDAAAGGSGECVVVFDATLQGVAVPSIQNLPALVSFTTRTAPVRDRRCWMCIKPSPSVTAWRVGRCAVQLDCNAAMQHAYGAVQVVATTHALAVSPRHGWLQHAAHFLLPRGAAVPCRRVVRASASKASKASGSSDNPTQVDRVPPPAPPITTMLFFGIRVPIPYAQMATSPAATLAAAQQCVQHDYRKGLAQEGTQDAAAVGAHAPATRHRGRRGGGQPCTPV